jgi:NADH dehydrogenase FAD-containing subunit
VLTSADDVVYERSWWTRRVLSGKLAQCGIDKICAQRCVSVTEDGVQLQSGKTIPADLVVWATGAAPSPLLQSLRVPLSESGWIKVRWIEREIDLNLQVRDTLQSVAFSNVFAVGDCCSIEGHPDIAKAGVYSVREGPILANNILALLRGETLLRYTPQGFFLALYCTGDGSAVSSYLGTSLSGEWVWRWKDSIDRAFMERFDVDKLGPVTSRLFVQQQEQPPQ